MTVPSIYRREVPRWPRLSARLSGAFLLGMAALLQACDDGQGPDAVVHVIEVTPPAAALLVGDSLVLTARPKGPDGTVRNGLSVQWSSPRADLVKVTGAGQTGTIVGLKAGLAEISAGTHGKIGLAQIEVRNRIPTAAALVPNATMAGGPDFTVIVTGTGFASDAVVAWNGVERATQYVSPTELRAVILAADIAATGNAEISVLNPLPGGGGSAALAFTIAAAGVAWVDMQPSAASVEAGQTVAFSATARDIFGQDLNLPMTWSSANEQIATVAQDGVVTGQIAGSTVIHAATASGVKGTAAVTVTGPPAGMPTITSITPDSIESNPDGLEIVIRGTGFVPTSGAFLNSSSRSTEYVSPTELKMYLWPGDLNQSSTPKIRVYNPGPHPGATSNAVNFRIVPGVWSVRINVTGLQLWPGQEQQVTATAYDEQNRPLTGRAVEWKSLHPQVATVDASGRIRAVAPGSATIDAKIGNRTGFIGVVVYEQLPHDVLYEGNHGGYSELWLLTLGPDAAPRRVLPAGTYASDPAASPDGSRIAFVGLSNDGARNIFVVDRDGSNLRQLTFDVADDDQPAWSRDGSRIAFRSTREGVSDIFVINAGGSGLANVTNNVQRGASGKKAAERPTWTPAGRIVFTYGYQLLSPLQYRLVSVKPDGSEWKELTNGDFFSDFEPEVSPDGKLIALRRVSQYGAIIDIVTSDGGALGWINRPGPGRTPSWSPDGAWLTYSQTTESGQSAIHVYNVFNWQERVIVPAGGRNPVWIRRN